MTNFLINCLKRRLSQSSRRPRRKVTNAKKRGLLAACQCTIISTSLQLAWLVKVPHTHVRRKLLFFQAYRRCKLFSGSQTSFCASTWASCADINIKVLCTSDPQVNYNPSLVVLATQCIVNIPSSRTDRTKSLNTFYIQRFNAVTSQRKGFA